MEAGRASDTAVYVAMGRALCQLRRAPSGFEDPFALGWLPPEHRRAVERRFQGAAPRTRREAFLFVVAETTARMMGPRTLEIDRRLVAAPAPKQVVLIGAGLDARAYRLDALAEAVVFELDHPASAAAKRAAVGDQVAKAAEVRRVPIDFARERLSDALERAGHEPSVPTRWVFEGVITYLTPGEVDAAIAAMAARSAEGSLLIATYNRRSPAQRFVSAVTARSGEPHRAWFEAATMSALLQRHGFGVRTDVDGVARARAFGVRPGPLEHLWVKHHRVVTAERHRSGAPASE